MESTKMQEDKPVFGTTLQIPSHSKQSQSHNKNALIKDVGSEIRIDFTKQ